MSCTINCQTPYPFHDNHLQAQLSQAQRNHAAEKEAWQNEMELLNERCGAANYDKDLLKDDLLCEKVLGRALLF